MLWIVILGFNGLLLTVGGVALGVYAWRNMDRASQLKCPLSRIGKLKPGYRKIRGKVAALGEPLLSPVSKKECVYCRLRVVEDKTTYHGRPDLPGGGLSAFFLFGIIGMFLYRVYDVGVSDTSASHSRRFLLDEEFDVLPIVEDDTGGVEVDLHRATVFAKEKVRIVSDDNHPPPSQPEKLLREEYDIDTVDDRGNFRRLNFIEEVLLVGTKVTVAGPVEELKSGDLRFQKRDDPVLVIEAGVEKEIQAARSRAIGCIIGSSCAIGVGLCCLLGAFFLIVRSFVVR
jgi:hypothetical protein